MPSKPYERIIGDFKNSICAHITQNGAEILKKHEDASALIVDWLNYLRPSQATGTADELLDGLQGAVLEVAVCLASGLVRPAIFGLRAQLDIGLAWIYFKDHSVEWAHLEDTGERYRLHSETLKYLRDYDPHFQKRFKIIRNKRSHDPDNPYALLSAHVHGQNTDTLPSLVEISQIIGDMDKCEECVELQRIVSEYLSDIMTSWFVREWPDLPKGIRIAVERRLGKQVLKDLCAE